MHIHELGEICPVCSTIVLMTAFIIASIVGNFYRTKKTTRQISKSKI